MKDFIFMIICFVVFLLSIFLMNGMFRYSRMELKKCKWNPYPKRIPKKRDGDDEGENLIRLMISRKNGTVCFDIFDIKNKSFNYDDVDAWKSVPMSYKAYKKMVFKVWNLLRKKNED